MFLNENRVFKIFIEMYIKKTTMHEFQNKLFFSSNSYMPFRMKERVLHNTCKIFYLILVLWWSWHYLKIPISYPFKPRPGMVFNIPFPNVVCDSIHFKINSQTMYFTYTCKMTWYFDAYFHCVMVFIWLKICIIIF